MYSDFFRVTYRNGSPFFYITCCLYIWDVIFTISSDSLPRSAIFISLYMYSLRKVPMMSHILTSRPSCTGIVAVISTYYVGTVGEVMSPGTAFYVASRNPCMLDPSLYRPS